MSYAVKFTAPVYVVVDDRGHVSRVVVEDDRLSEPLALVPAEVDPLGGGGWGPEREIPWSDVSDVDKQTYAHDASHTPNGWPGWDFGW